jgi:hypothetical protein
LVEQLFERFGFEDAFFVQDLADLNQVGLRPHRTPVKLNCLFPINSDDLVPRPRAPDVPKPMRLAKRIVNDPDAVDAVPRKKVPRGCVLHKDALPLADVEEREGFRVTTPFRTLLDVACGDLNHEQLEKAVADALNRGLMRRARLVSAVRADPRLQRLARILNVEAAKAS